MSPRPRKPARDTHRLVIPTRQAVIDLLAAGTPKTFAQIARDLGVDDEQRQRAFRRRIKAMQRDGQIVLNRQRRYGVTSKMDLYQGTVIGHSDGYGFLNVDSEQDDLFLSPREMRRLLHGDRIIARLVAIDSRGRREGAVVDILARANQRIVGRYFKESEIAFVDPENKRIHQDILIQSPPAKLAAGCYVVADIIHQPEQHTPPIGKIINVLGDSDTTDIAVQVACHAYEIPTIWHDKVRSEATRYQRDSLDISDRKDLRDLPFVTIDGEESCDFDDAVYATVHGAGFHLYVAIADVSHYVRPDSAIDEEALSRGNSVYFSEHVVPMLPEVLSNDLCSLNPNTDRLCLVVRLAINAQGQVIDRQFFEGVIHSVARMNYDEVARLLEEDAKQLDTQYSTILPHLQTLYSVYQALRQHRSQDGILDFDTVECRFEFDKSQHVIGIYALKRNEAHCLIEECMLAANVAAAEFLLSHKIPALYRVHEPPNASKLEALRGFLGELSLSLDGADSPSANDYVRLLDQVADRHDKNLIETVLLRSMRMANYSEQNLGHFGLAFSAYTHFTSPIRRYADLIVHRAVRYLIRKRRDPNFQYTATDLHEIAKHCSETERRADEATRSVEKWHKCHFMQRHIGEVFKGIISGVTAFGVFVTLDDSYVDGLLHITALPADYYHYDAAAHRLKGERHNRSFQLGDRIVVRVARVDIDNKQIDFDWAG